tara:strand:- start:343 stop:633 length:291 start_codon:yes stop_codon:yes gene_type:complete
MTQRQTPTQEELYAIIASMEALDAGNEIEIDEEDYDDIGDNELYEDDPEYDPIGDAETEYDIEFDGDGQPDEYTEWQDYMGGDEYYDHSENCLGDY